MRVWESNCVLIPQDLAAILAEGVGYPLKSYLI
jgi:hypothetical protein